MGIFVFKGFSDCKIGALGWIFIEWFFNYLISGTIGTLVLTACYGCSTGFIIRGLYERLPPSGSWTLPNVVNSSSTVTLTLKYFVMLFIFVGWELGRDFLSVIGRGLALYYWVVRLLAGLGLNIALGLELFKW